MKRIILYLLLLFGMNYGFTYAQKLYFAETFNRDGSLKNPDSVFSFQAPHIIRAVKFIAPATLPSETLYVIVKDYEKVVGRFYMKRSKRKPNEGNALIRLKDIGIFRVYIYNPQNRTRPLGKGYVFVTNSEYPTPKSLVIRQLKILVNQGKIPKSILEKILNKQSKDAMTQQQNNTTTSTTTSTSNSQQTSTASSQNQSTENPQASLDSESLEDLSMLGELDDDGFTEGDLAALDNMDLDDDDLLLDDLFEDELADTGSGDDFAGEFESFDTLDDDFDFEISDF